VKLDANVNTLTDLITFTVYRLYADIAGLILELEILPESLRLLEESKLLITII
jgi:hypothetical protein